MKKHALAILTAIRGVNLAPLVRLPLVTAVLRVIHALKTPTAMGRGLLDASCALPLRWQTPTVHGSQTVFVRWASRAMTGVNAIAVKLAPSKTRLAVQSAHSVLAFRFQNPSPQMRPIASAMLDILAPTEALVLRVLRAPTKALEVQTPVRSVPWGPTPRV